jgi:N-carbamoyl-L-amino-acid hydrolase
MAAWSCEEGVAFGKGLAGSRIAAGDVKPADMDQTWNGLRRGDAIRKIGGDPDRITSAIRPKGAHHAYLELHIEQGGNLDRDGVPIGIVEGIVAIERFTAVVTGFANHAGTTPMPERKDALLAASHLAIAVREIVTGEPGRQVGTVGQFDVTPNAANVIPGSVRLTIELRDLSTEKLSRMATAIRGRAAQIASATQTAIDITPLSSNPPAFATPAIQTVIARVSRALRLEQVLLPSGASHDAASMAQLGPMGMIFVPSVGGISHSPKELTRWEDCANGADVLRQTILEVDRL